MAEKTITININDADEKAMLHNIVDIDVYIQALVLNKIEGCWRRFRREWTTRLTDDDSFTDDIPVTKTALINLVSMYAPVVLALRRPSCTAIPLEVKLCTDVPRFSESWFNQPDPPINEVTFPGFSTGPVAKILS